MRFTTRDAVLLLCGSVLGIAACSSDKPQMPTATAAAEKSASKEIEATKITIVDDAGEPRLVLGTKADAAVITLLSRNYEPSIVISSRESGLITLCDGDAKPRISLFHDPVKNQSNMRLDDRSGITRAQMINMGTNAGMTIKSAAGKPLMGIADDGILIYNEREQVRWSAP